MLKLGVIGCGYWGPNLIRNFTIARHSKVIACSDLDDKRLQHMQELYPHLRATPSLLPGGAKKMFRRGGARPACFPGRNGIVQCSFHTIIYVNINIPHQINV